MSTHFDIKVSGPKSVTSVTNGGAASAVLKVYPDKNTRKDSYNAIIELNDELAKSMIEKGRISID